jgi:hypothetical protein
MRSRAFFSVSSRSFMEAPVHRESDGNFKFTALAKNDRRGDQQQ